MQEEKSISRVSFIKLGVLGASAMAVGSLVGCSSDDKSINEDASSSAAVVYTSLPKGAEWTFETDILIAGCGAGGAPTAIDAIDGGADVLIIEKASWIGGMQRRCAGGICGAGTKVQSALGIKDSPELLYNYMVSCGEGFVDEKLLRVVADESGATVDWILHDLGGHLPHITPAPEDWKLSTPEDKGMTICMKPGLNVSGTPVFFEDYGMEPIQRCHWVFPNPEDTADDRGYAQYDDGISEGRGGTGMWKIFEDALTKRNANIKTETELKRLIVKDDKEVIGAIAQDSTGEIYIKAKKAVIIATGGWAGNEYLMRTYQMDDAQLWYAELPDGTIELDGAGVVAAMDLGAATTNMGAPRFGYQSGGLVINTDAQVMDQYGEPIPRLYATSYAVGGRQYEKYPQCGLNTIWQHIFGRHAAAHALTLDFWK
jgi:hypothetical protein